MIMPSWIKPVVSFIFGAATGAFTVYFINERKKEEVVEEVKAKRKRRTWEEIQADRKKVKEELMMEEDDVQEEMDEIVEEPEELIEDEDEWKKKKEKKNKKRKDYSAPYRKQTIKEKYIEQLMDGEEPDCFVIDSVQYVSEGLSNEKIELFYDPAKDIITDEDNAIVYGRSSYICDGALELLCVDKPSVYVRNNTLEADYHIRLMDFMD